MLYFIVACIILGLGIGLDVFLATLSRVKYLTPARGLTWIRRITATHIAFPMVGYYGFIELFRIFPALRGILGLTAVSLILYFLVDVIKGWFEIGEECQDRDPFSWAVVLSVSWDALFSGPAKSAQAINWNYQEVLASFFISGLIVATMTIIAVRLTLSIHKAVLEHTTSSVNTHIRYQIVMMFAEVSIFLYFGILAFARYSLSSDIPSWQVGLISILSCSLLYFCLRHRLLPIMNKKVLLEITVT